MGKWDIRVDMIEKFMAENGLSRSAFARKCKVGYSTLNKIFIHDYSFRIRLLYKISKVMGVSVVDLIED